MTRSIKPKVVLKEVIRFQCSQCQDKARLYSHVLLCGFNTRHDCLQSLPWQRPVTVSLFGEVVLNLAGGEKKKTEKKPVLCTGSVFHFPVTAGCPDKNLVLMIPQAL